MTWEVRTNKAGTLNVTNKTNRRRQTLSTRLKYTREGGDKDTGENNQGWAAANQHTGEHEDIKTPEKRGKLKYYKIKQEAQKQKHVTLTRRSLYRYWFTHGGALQ